MTFVAIAIQERITCSALPFLIRDVRVQLRVFRKSTGADRVDVASTFLVVAYDESMSFHTVIDY